MRRTLRYPIREYIKAAMTRRKIAGHEFTSVPMLYNMVRELLLTDGKTVSEHLWTNIQNVLYRGDPTSRNLKIFDAASDDETRLEMIAQVVADLLMGLSERNRKKLTTHAADVINQLVQEVSRGSSLLSISLPPLK